jgi:ubiquinone/menaquinone biosynthesis C-methylase UbiE
MTKSLVQQQFGAHAAAYATSTVHAKGASLGRLVELVAPAPHWQALDVATGAGHTAAAFAPHVARVIASDLTEAMLAEAAKLAVAKGLANMETARADAEALPFQDRQFDLVTCRIAPHHFDSIAAFLDEVRRVLKQDGAFALVDNVVPAGSVGDFVNAFERFRDPSHLRAWTTQEWRAALAKHGFAIAHEEELSKEMEFAYWAGRHDANMQAFLRAMLEETTPAVKAFLTPTGNGADLKFWLREALFIARPA